MSENTNGVVIGKITTAHGIHGELKMGLFIDDPEMLQEFETIFIQERGALNEYKIRSVRFHHNYALLTLEGITSRTAALELRGREVSVPHAWLPEPEEGEYYVADIIGLSVLTTEGEWLGEIEDVIFIGANEVYVVQGGPHGEICLPAIASVVQAVDLENGKLIVILPEGLL